MFVLDRCYISVTPYGINVRRILRARLTIPPLEAYVDAPTKSLPVPATVGELPRGSQKYLRP